ncbi:hypothetical protein FQA47_024280 [Oryzias melastigma]|uniref:Uncharacterized protein n=1 Tax=Oryzias melastigma TaxID=30732 RepID=A0A834BYZ5_ORYME|nr:hypothetical protein FQA47_024280 [Oryzias melastigma]
MKPSDLHLLHLHHPKRWIPAERARPGTVQGFTSVRILSTVALRLYATFSLHFLAVSRAEARRSAEFSARAGPQTEQVSLVGRRAVYIRHQRRKRRQRSFTLPEINPSKGLRSHGSVSEDCSRTISAKFDRSKKCWLNLTTTDT